MSKTDARSTSRATEEKQILNNAKLSELFSRLKNIIFFKGILVQSKINSILKCCLEWIILAATQFLSERSLFKSVSEMTINNGYV